MKEFFIGNTIYTRGLSRRKMESVFGHFTKFNVRKTGSLQYSISGKRTLYKIQHQKNELFIKFNIRKKGLFTKLNMHYTSMKVFRVFTEYLLFYSFICIFIASVDFKKVSI